MDRSSNGWQASVGTVAQHPLKDCITRGKLRELKRVEDFIARNPQCNAQQMSAALKIKSTTLNGYTLALRRLGRVVKTKHKYNRLGSLPDTFEVVPGLEPLATAKPIQAPPKTSAQEPAAAPTRMDLVASLFGPAKGVMK